MNHNLLRIIEAVRSGHHRFEAIHVETGMGRNILTDCIKLLVEQGTLVRVPYQSNPLRFEFHLSDDHDDGSAGIPAMIR